jgi:transcriptional regulator with XRE-family HTH domain
MDAGIRELRAKGGSYRSIGARLGVSAQAVNRWRRIPQDRILQVEKEFKIPREVLRPDLYKRKS